MLVMASSRVNTPGTSVLTLAGPAHCGITGEWPQGHAVREPRH